MGRSNKLQCKQVLREPSERLIEKILEDVIRAAGMSFDEWRSLNQFPFISLAIPVDAQREYRVTQAGVNAAHQLAEQVWTDRKDFQQTISRDEFNKLSFRAIGESILNCSSYLPKHPSNEPQDEIFFTTLVAEYGRNLEKLVELARPDVQRHIPCHLFRADQGVSPFLVGPVEFLPRSHWLDRYVTSSDELELIKTVESGTLDYSTFRDQALAPDSDSQKLRAWEILTSLANFDWVATITVRGHELNQSHQKASIIVGLAIDAIGLRFQLDDARRFTKAGRQHLYSENRLATTSRGIFLKGSSIQIPGIGWKPGALITKMAAERPFLDAAGKVLEVYLQGRQTASAPHLIERWANALYWVGEARREATDFMAVVNYGCAADGLSGAGGNADKMTAFAEAALNPSMKSAPQGALSVADAVSKVYREGRNKLAHGEMTGLFEDLSRTRAIGDALLVNLFDAFTFELAKIIAERPEILTIDEKNAYRALQTRLQQRPHPT